MGLISKIENSVFKDGVAQEDNDFELTPDQESAIRTVQLWFDKRGRSPAWKPFLVISGPAGTGKSSIIQYIIRNLGLSENDVLCAAFTGKASLNLLRKGNHSSTLHSSIYDCIPNEYGKMPIFERKQSIPYKLIIVDEASMISAELFDDIMSFGIPTIFIGDHCQLPPVIDKFNIMQNPDFILTTIMRQAAKSPIIRASQLAIQGKPIPVCDFNGFRKIRYKDLKDEDFLWADQIIVGTNAMRRAINDAVREMKGYRNRVPQEGERMICLRNNSRLGICNGQILYLASEPYYDDIEKCYYACWMDELEKTDSLIALASSLNVSNFRFKMKDPNSEPADVKIWEYAYLDFGYAISCHKSQGSGWERVMVFDEGFGRDEDTKRRWLYTAITRAKKEILIVKK